MRLNAEVACILGVTRAELLDEPLIWLREVKAAWDRQQIQTQLRTLAAMHATAPASLQRNLLDELAGITPFQRLLNRARQAATPKS